MDRKIKKDGTYKSRFVTVADKEHDKNYDGYTYAPTAISKIMWLLFTVSVILCLICCTFDIKHAFLTEESERDGCE
jgi:hypothetical protein